MSVYSTQQNFDQKLGILDSDDFGQIQVGGVVNVRFGTVVYTQNGTTAYICTLPKKAEIVGWMVNVKTGFDDSGTDVLDIGDFTTANKFANDIDISSAGQIVTGFDDDEMFEELSAETKIAATYTGQNSNATAGEADVAVFFILR